MAVDIFAEVHRVMPSDAALEAMEYEDRGVLTLRGSTSRVDAVFECAKELEKTMWFSAVRVRYVTKRVVEGRETADFEIQAQIGKEPEKSDDP